MSEMQYAGSFTMIMSDKASNWDFFRGTLSDENCANWKVTINNEVSTQKANSLTFKEGDIIKIEYNTTPCLFHPGHDSDHHNGHISSISGALPYFNGTDPTAVPINSSDIFRGNSGVFEECGDLISISEDLFIHWENVTNFNYVFASAGYSAPELSEIPENLFANNTKVTSFAHAFNCYQSNARDVPIIIPEKLFYNNTLATNFEKVFAYRNISELHQDLFKNNPNITNMKGSFYSCSHKKEFSLNLTNCNNISDSSDFNYRSSYILTAYINKDSTTDTSFISAGGEDEFGAYVKVIYGTPLEINDQKLIDIVYVDNEGNKHKYSGPFINDLTITSEIQEKLTALDTLNTQIGKLKTKLETLGTTITSTGSKIKYAENIYQYEDDINANNIIPVILENGQNIAHFTIGLEDKESGSTVGSYGWVDMRRIKNLSSGSIVYLGISSDLNLNDLALSPTSKSGWEDITSYKPSNLVDIANITFNGNVFFENNTFTNDPPIVNLGGNEELTLIITDSSSNTWTIKFERGFKPGE